MFLCTRLCCKGEATVGWGYAGRAGLHCSQDAGHWWHPHYWKCAWPKHCFGLFCFTGNFGAAFHGYISLYMGKLHFSSTNHHLLSQTLTHCNLGRSFSFYLFLLSKSIFKSDRKACELKLPPVCLKLSFHIMGNFDISHGFLCSLTVDLDKKGRLKLKFQNRGQVVTS